MREYTKEFYQWLKENKDKLKGIGERSVNEIKLRLEELGVTLTKGNQKQRKIEFSIRKYMSERRSKEEQKSRENRELKEEVL